MTTEKKSTAKNSSQRVSPELDEFLHMMNALEAQFNNPARQPSATR